MRPTLDEWAMALAVVVATRATCARRAVGCVLLDSKGRVLSTGYNGPPRGAPHCNEVTGRVLYADEPLSEQSYTPIYGHSCAGLGLASGQGLDLCAAIHAEQNALIFCGDADAIATCYSTTEPCAHCAKMLLNTGCQRVVYKEPYSAGSGRSHWDRLRKEGTWVLLSD